MKKTRRPLLMLCGVLSLTQNLAGCAKGPDSTGPDVVPSAEAFLNAYAAGNKPTVMAMVDPDVHVYGSDVAEVFTGKAGFAHLFEGDTQLWHGTAHFGQIKDVSTYRQGSVASLFFDVPFSVGDRPEVTVRIATVWRLTNGAWLLVQSSNVVPTVGQSSDVILRKARQ